MEYSTRIPFHGEPESALKVAQGVLASNGFSVDLPGPKRLVAHGPGMSSTRERSLLGATRVEIRVDFGEIQLDADLGGVRRMRAFVFLFPPGLALVLAIGFLLSGFPPKAAMIAFLAVSPWLVLSPVMAVWMRGRTVRTLDALLHNMVSLSES